MTTDFVFLTAFLGGVLSFLSPCVLPLVPGYLSYIAGIRIEDAASNDTQIRKKMLTSALLFVAGFSLVFIFFAQVSKLNLNGQFYSPLWDWFGCF